MASPFQKDHKLDLDRHLRIRRVVMKDMVVLYQKQNALEDFGFHSHNFPVPVMVPLLEFDQQRYL